jgi:hypothetical protein
MKSFKHRFNTLLLRENSQFGNPQFDPSEDSATFDDSLDPDVDPDAFLTKGLKETIDAVQKSFDEKMKGFANDLSPESIKGMTLGQLKATVDKTFKYVKGIAVYSKSKLDAMASSPSAILAGFIASDPAKQSSFDELVKKIEEFSGIIEETQSQIATIKSKIDEFVEDIIEDDEDEMEPELDEFGDDEFSEFEADPSMNASGPSGPSPLGGLR